MNFEFFFFLVYMSIVSFAVAFLAYGMVVRFMGKDGFGSRLGQIIMVPACIIFYDFITIASGDYRYLVGSIPLAVIASQPFLFAAYRRVRRRKNSFFGDILLWAKSFHLFPFIQRKNTILLKPATDFLRQIRVLYLTSRSRKLNTLCSMINRYDNLLKSPFAV